jgi:signal transduction histidine kinase
VDGPLPERVEVAAYYVASEALTNAAKHARASAVRCERSRRTAACASSSATTAWAARTRGLRLLGLKDRVEAIGGRIEVSSTRRQADVRATSRRRRRAGGPVPP